MTDRSASPRLDKERPRTLRWFLIGAISGLFLMWTQALAVGGWTGLLSVGEDSLLRPLIETELPGLVLVPGEGNDGQIYYALGVDLAGVQAPELINNPELRYQRIVYPLLASLGGTLHGYPVLWLMVGLSIVGLGFAAAAVERLRFALNLSGWVQLGLFLNPGIWLSVRQLTPDMLGVGICLIGAALAVEKRWTFAIAAHVVGALTKESLVLFAGGLALWLLLRRDYRLGLLIGGAPSLAVFAWAFPARAISGGEGRIGGGHWSFPFKGIVEAWSFWPTTPTREQLMTVLVFGTLLIGLAAFAFSRSLFARSLLLPWLVLPVITSEWVWRYGNSSLRGFAPIGVVAGVALAGIGNRDALNREHAEADSF